MKHMKGMKGMKMGGLYIFTNFPSCACLEIFARVGLNLSQRR
jgi:hypothetical protein